MPFGRLAACVPLLSLLASCTTTIRPPVAVNDPARVLVLTHGISSSLVLPDERGGGVRFAYGDWRYYALGQTGLCETLAAVLWPTRAALGRQVIEPAMIERLSHEVAVAIVVDRKAVDGLRARLEAIFFQAIDSWVYNPGHRLEFVTHPQPYSLRNNSNRQVARWLRELGAEVSGVPLLPKWIEAPAR
ncbi:MAG TPA: hypothetical protein VM779_04765 [Thermoanaerobaculia bacterium]|nr:hypothetical protein [Thermoanaerobaculia bacterium]